MDAIEVVSPAAGPVVDPAVLVAVSEAVRAREILRFGYPAGEDEVPRRVEPHAVVAHRGRWYLLAWDPAATDARVPNAADGDWRTFRVDRLSRRSPTRLSFTPRELPGGDAAAFVVARFRGSDTGWPCVGSAIVELPADAITPYLEPDAVVEPLAANRSRVTMGSWSWIALAARFAGLGAELTELDPDDLRTAASELGRRLLAPG